MFERISKLRRGFAAVLAVIFLIALFPGAALAGASKSTFSRSDREALRSGDFRRSELSPFPEEGMPTRSFTHTPSDDYSLVRVLITTGSVSTISFRLSGAYFIEQNDAPISGTEASPVTVSITAASGSVTASVGENVLYTGPIIDICRVNQAEAGGYAELRTTGNSSNNGRKYLGSLRLSANSNGTVRYINVVPTAHYLYGIIPYEMSEGCNIEALKAQAVTAKSYAFAFPYGDSDYDISDSFTYQGYRGYVPGYPKCMQACLAVVGKVLIYNGSVPLTFYGATNGGETALPSHAFGTSPLDSAYEIRLDNIDFQYGSSKVKTHSVTYGASVTNSSMRSLLAAEAASAVGHSVEIVSILSCSLNTPKYTGCARNMTKMDADVRVNDDGEESTVHLSFNVSKLKTYGVFSGSYKIYWGEPTSNGYNIYFCRYGHGLGLSQYGADGYAAEGWGYSQILNFYFRKMQLTTVTERNPEEEYQTDEIAAYGVINTNSVRMRTGPGLEYAIIDAFPANTHVDIITEVDGWLLCTINAMLGYIRGDLVDITLYTSPYGAVQEVGRARISDGVDDAVFRTGPSSYASAVFTPWAGLEFEIWHEIGSWYHIRYGGRFFYVEKAKVTVQIWYPIDLHSMLNETTGKIIQRP